MIRYLLILFLVITSSYAEQHHPQEFLNSIHGSKNEGEQIYNHFCVNCHAQKPMIPLGAPRIGEINDWKPRMQQGLKILLKHTDEGLNAMPPRGGCFECTDQQLILAIIAMLPSQDQKVLLNELEANKKYTK